MTKLIVLPPAAKFLKKIKDKKLKMEYQKAIDSILMDHTIGDAKSGDLNGVFGFDIYYNKTNYELAYTVEYQDEIAVVIIMAGTRENFYEQLKRYMKKSIHILIFLINYKILNSEKSEKPLYFQRILKI